MIPTQSRLAYANGFLELGMTKEAEEELTAIVVVDRQSYEVLVMKNRLYMTKADWKKLVSAGKALARKFPEERFGWINWAYALREIDQTAKAKEVVLDGLKEHPTEAVLWYNLACYCSLLDELPESATYLSKAKRYDESFEKEAENDPDLDALREWLNQGE